MYGQQNKKILNLYTIKCFFIIYQRQVCKQIYSHRFSVNNLRQNVKSVHERPYVMQLLHFCPLPTLALMFPINISLLAPELFFKILAHLYIKCE